VTIKTAITAERSFSRNFTNPVLRYELQCILAFSKQIRSQILVSQAARQGLALLMASAVVVLKHETLTLRQRHNFISIDFKFGVGDYVSEVTNPDKVGSGPISGRDAIWGQHNTDTVTFYIYFNRATAHTRKPIFAHNSSEDVVWCKEDPFCGEKCVIFTLKTPLKFVAKGITS